MNLFNLTRVEWKEGLTPQHLVHNLSSFGQWTCEFLSTFIGRREGLTTMELAT
jgi:hypothetical protein